MRFRQIIREYFSFSKSERTGLTVLIVLMIVLLIADRLVFYFEKPVAADRGRFNEMLDELKRQEARQRVGSLFRFDPNTIDSMTLDSLALPARAKQNLLKYRRNGGSFKERRDLRKIYGMNDSAYERIEQFIAIRETKVRPVSADSFPERVIEKQIVKKTVIGSEQAIRPSKIEINRATAGEFMKLYGIGPVLSERIVKYRTLLGGFYALGQLTEVYGFHADLLSRISGQMEVDSSALIPININFANAAELARHPYLEWNDARRVIRYREKKGFIEDKSQLREDSVLSEEVLKKVAPYLQTDH